MSKEAAQRYKDNAVVEILNNIGKHLGGRRDGGYTPYGTNVMDVIQMMQGKEIKDFNQPRYDN